VEDCEPLPEPCAVAPHDATDGLNQRVQKLERRQGKLEERLLQDRFSLDGPTPVQWVEVQAELERLRRLFEFVESVMPKSASDAMKFFNRGRIAPAGEHRDLKIWSAASVEASRARPLGAEVEIERHKAQLEYMLQKMQTEFHDEVQHCMLAVKNVERIAETTRQLVQTGSRRPRSSSANRSRATTPQAASAVAAEFDFATDLAAHAPSAPVKRLDQTNKALQRLQQDLEVTREDVKSWLDDFHNHVTNALKMKADKAREEVQFAEEGLAAALARRSLVGCCASCGGGPKGTIAAHHQFRPKTSPGVHQLRSPTSKLPKFDTTLVRLAKPGRATSAPMLSSDLSGWRPQTKGVTV